MHFTCVICSDLITGSDDTFATSCGHLFHYNCVIQWLERSKTCPQCRAKVYEKDIHRVYFNVANIDGSDDPSSLQNKIDNLKFKLKMKDVEVKTANEAKADMEGRNKGLRAELRKQENEVSKLNGAILCLKERMNHLKNENKKMNQLQEENKVLQSRVETLQGLETIRVGSAAEVDELLNNMAGSSSESRSLATYCSVLKRELQVMEKKRKVTQARMAEHSQNLSKAYAERDSLKDALKVSGKARGDLMEELAIIKEEKSRLEKKIKQLENMMESTLNTNTQNSAVGILSKLTVGSPARESMATEMLRLLAESPAPEELLSTLKRVARSPMKLYPPSPSETLKRSRIEETLTPEVCLPAKRNVQLSFPKLSDPSKDIKLLPKPSSSGSQPRMENKTTNILQSKSGYTIFQKPRLSQRPEEILQKPLRDEVYYDGMGGQRKQDVFPNPKRNPLPLGAKPKLKKSTFSVNSAGIPRIDTFLSNSSQ
ncbi:E3 ubiquitin-protein ligase TRAIP-like [Ischnura elegans]|uniref:E3 ubiquitin-protein ligase TRAIP-like n=1 Tax=Ischnura elegans TaxID=197161 RepID=UPI001ED86F9B|nr:E3 ubiquitin-protein ligase TRAIP-like [Ischnura elegans]